MEYQNRTAYITIKTERGTTRKVFEALQNHDWVIGAWIVSGTNDVMAWTNARSQEETYTYANSIRTIPGVNYTHSHFVHGGYVNNMDEMKNPTGVWVWIRATDMNSALANIKKYPTVANWACMPGEYDYLAYMTGKNMNETLDNILNMSEQNNWQTYTEVPVKSYFNPNYTNTKF
jgi:hypothetical protein